MNCSRSPLVWRLVPVFCMVDFIRGWVLVGWCVPLFWASRSCWSVFQASMGVGGGVVPCRLIVVRLMVAGRGRGPSSVAWLMAAWWAVWWGRSWRSVHQVS